MNIEDRATQPMEAGGWVLQYFQEDDETVTLQTMTTLVHIWPASFSRVDSSSVVNDSMNLPWFHSSFRRSASLVCKTLSENIILNWCVEKGQQQKDKKYKSRLRDILSSILRLLLQHWVHSWCWHHKPQNSLELCFTLEAHQRSWQIIRQQITENSWNVQICNLIRIFKLTDIYHFMTIATIIATTTTTTFMLTGINVQWSLTSIKMIMMMTTSTLMEVSFSFWRWRNKSLNVCWSDAPSVSDQPWLWQ